MLVVAVVLGAGTGPTAGAAHAQVAQQRPSERDAGWQRDLEALVACLKQKHKDAFFKLDPQRFEEAVRQLRRQIPALNDHEVLVELLKLTALLEDGHTTLWPWQAPERYRFRRYPVQFVSASDGLFVEAATDEYRSLLGAKVIAIGKLQLDDVFARVYRLRGAENASGRENAALQWLNQAEPLAALGIVEDIEQARLTVLDTSGKEVQALLHPLPVGATPELVYGFDASAENVFASRRVPRSLFGYRWLEDVQTLYCWYDTCDGDRWQELLSWSGKVLNEVDDRPVERVVVDLRRNGGGNEALALTLILGLAGRDKVNQRGKLFVLVGRGTFSSAMSNALTFRQTTTAVLIGLPTGGSPNAMGEIKRDKLPYSGWLVQYSTEYHSRTSDGANTVAPDVEVEWSSAEYFAGRDPVLEAALEYEPPDDSEQGE